MSVLIIRIILAKWPKETYITLRNGREMKGLFESGGHLLRVPSHPLSIRVIDQGQINGCH